jgi:hypothetical protein
MMRIVLPVQMGVPNPSILHLTSSQVRKCPLYPLPQPKSPEKLPAPLSSPMPFSFLSDSKAGK